MGKRVPKRLKQQFAKTLKAWRTNKGLTQTEAAERLEVPVKTLQNWEIARTMPTGFGYTSIMRVLTR
jgi:DNA-binding transcriptional regulator YiaG